jgi:hypothetical protein
VEFDQAISYVNKIKTRFQARAPRTRFCRSAALRRPHARRAPPGPARRLPPRAYRVAVRARAARIRSSAFVN